MNEAETKSRPAEDEALFSMEDLEAAEAEEETTDTMEDTIEPSTEEVGTPTETEVKEVEVDYKPLLENLSKNIKYMDEDIKIESIDDVIKNYQKGLDYDRKNEKLNELENGKGLTYLREQAKKADMSIDDYIEAIKDYEVKQEKIREEEEIQRLVDEDGVSEVAARRMLEAERKSANAEKLAKEVLAEREAKKAEEEAKRKTEAENELFLQTYPNVDIKSIPKEVFVDAEKTNLLTAYTRYQNQQLVKELELLKQNTKNEKSSPVTGTTEHGGVVIETQDDFLKGFKVD